jgi:hypothetical protein
MGTWRSADGTGVRWQEPTFTGPPLKPPQSTTQSGQIVTFPRPAVAISPPLDGEAEEGMRGSRCPGNCHLVLHAFGEQTGEGSLADGWLRRSI